MFCFFNSWVQFYYLTFSPTLLYEHQHLITRKLLLLFSMGLALKTSTPILVSSITSRIPAKRMTGGTTETTFRVESKFRYYIQALPSIMDNVK